MDETMYSQYKGVVGMDKDLTRMLTRGGVIAALYVLLTAPLGQLGYGIILGPFTIQFRPAEVLTVLPVLFPEAVPAVFIGVLVANLISQFGWVDVLCGSLITLVAAIVTRKTRGSIIAWLSPVVFNALLVSLYVAWFIAGEWGTRAWWLAYVQNAASIGISQALVVFGLGIPLVATIRKVLLKEY
jgi:uncharacterized membrane protein